MLIFLANVYVYCRHPFLVSQFVRRLGAWPNVAAPRDFYEKMFWRRVFDNNPTFTELADKLRVKDHIASHHVGLKFAPVLWSGTEPAAIPDSALSGDVFLKANHGNSFNLRINGKVDRQEMEKTAQQWMRRKYGRKYRETGYWGIDRRLFIERALTSNGEIAEFDFKFYVAGGTVTAVFVQIDRFKPSIRAAILDRDGISHRIDMYHFGVGVDFTPPGYFPELVRLAERMGSGIDMVRMDFIATGEQYFFGEYTFYSQGGFDEWERDHPLVRHVSDQWDLRQSWPLSTRGRGLMGLYANALRRRLDAEAARQPAR